MREGMKKKNMIIAIEARIPGPEIAGGISQVIMSLARNLSALDDTSMEYVFVGWENAQDWLGNYIGGACRLKIVPSIAPSPGAPASRESKFWRKLFSPSRRSAEVIAPVEQLPAKSDGTVEMLGASLVHFPAQSAYLTNLPSIYHPHDLQHLHMPEHFDANSLRVRLITYRAFCARATFVSVETEWIKEDVVKKLDISADKVVVIPVVPPVLPAVSMTSPAAVAAARKAKFSKFILYPAQTWPHKNHLGLIEALALLKQRWGLTIPLVCTGHRNVFFSEIEAKIDACGLTDELRFLGFVEEDELSALYRLATAVVVPTKFESLSLPVWEAFAAGTAVACSNVTSLPEQIDGAGLLFNPDDPADIASAVRRIWEDEMLRAQLIKAGAERVKCLTGHSMAQAFQTLYRRALGVGLDSND